MLFWSRSVGCDGGNDGGCDSATSGHHDAREGRRRWSGRPSRLSQRIAASRSTCSGTTESHGGPSALDAAPASLLRAAAQNRRSRGHTGAHAREPARDSRSVSTLHTRARRRSCSIASACSPPRAQRAPSWSGRDAERARALRTPTVGPERSVRRLESRAPAVELALSSWSQSSRRACLRRAGADSGSPPPIQIGISSQQAGPSRATVRARIAFGTPSRAGRANPNSPGYPRGPPPIEGRRGRRLARARPLSPLAATRHLSGFAAVWPRQLLVPGRPGRVCHLRAELRPSCYHARGSAALGGRRSIRGDRRLGRGAADSPGRIHTSPRSTGLTGATAWFCRPAPRSS